MERVYVANLPPDIRIKDIDDFFRPFGKLVYIDVNHRASPVYALVQFDSPRNAFNAVKARHGYDYEGYTLQLRLVENEVRKQRDTTPPPPPPSMYNIYERQNVNGGFGNNYNNNRMNQNYSSNSSNSQWPSNNRSNVEQFLTTDRPSTRQQNMDFSSASNRSNMQQLNMTAYSSDSRPIMEQTFANSTRSNMQQFSNTNFSNMQQQYTNFNRPNTQQQYSSIGHSNMSHSNFGNRPDMTQQNITQYSSVGMSNMQQQLSNSNSSNIPQLQKMNIQSPNNSSWDTRNVGMDWNTGHLSTNFNNSKVNSRSNATYLKDVPYTRNDIEDKFTMGLSGAGRKWFNRFLRKGFSPEMARARALEHRRLPYLRGQSNNTIPNDPTNAALETIGNTIISLFTNTSDNSQPGPSNNMERSSNQMTSQRSSVAPRPPSNAVSRRQYVKSMDVLKTIKGKRIKSSKDKISLKYHTQIVKDYQKFTKDTLRNESGTSKSTTSKSTPSRRETSQREYMPIISNRTEKQLSELLIKEKAKLLKKSRELESKTRNTTRNGGAYKKRTKILLDHGFLEIEAKSLAFNPLSSLEELLKLKKEYNLLEKKTVFIPASKSSLANAPKGVVYRNDLQYLEEYAKHRINGLSKTILYGLSECLKRIHDYEKNERLPLTETKFTKLLVKITSRENFFKNTNKMSPHKKNDKTTAAGNKDVKESKPQKSEIKADKVENQDDATNSINDGIQDDNYQNDDEDIDDDGGEEEFEDVEIIEDDEGNENEDAEDQNAEE